MLRLFIENREIELTEDVQFAITKQFDDLSNPTSIINDWSKTVSIPFSVNNNEVFGYIYNPNRVISTYQSFNFLSNYPSSIKKWGGVDDGGDYVNDVLVDGQIVCDYNVQYLQVGLLKTNWTYTQTNKYYGDRGTGSFAFMYDRDNCHRFEFSLRDPQSSANNGEVYFIQWELYNQDLREGDRYVVNFSYEQENGVYRIYDFSLTREEPLVGIYFDPLKKLDFRLEWNNDIVMTGYAKMNQVKQVSGKGTYEITLFGKLGKIFQDLSKVTFNINNEDANYVIDGSKYVDATINKSLVVSSWNSNGQSTYSLEDSTITDIIGFAPNNTYYEEFDSGSFQNDASEAKTFTDVLKIKWDNGKNGYVTGVDPETAIPDGLLPRDIGEFRSYYQTPFIYWNKLWQIFQKKAEILTGYEWDMDSDWFNPNNPYWSKLVYMLKPFNVKNGTSLENHYTKWGYNAAQCSLGLSTTPGVPQVVRKFAMPTGSSVVTTNKIEAYPLLPTYGDPDYDSRYPHYPTTVATFKCPEDFSSITYRWTIPMFIETKYSGSHLRDNAGLIVSIKMWGCDDNVTQANARVVQTNNYIIRHEGSGFTYSNYTPIDTGSSSSKGDDKYKLVYTIQSNFAASAAKCGPYCYFTIECSYTNKDPMTNGLSDQGHTWYRDAYVDVNLASGAFRSGTHFTLNDLWNNDYNLFEQILNYCKMYRILIFVDEHNKKLKFIKASKYFQTYTISDWTDKLDMSKDFIITPTSFSNKYVLFNYEDNKTKLGEKYKETWGVNYGEKRLVTQYNFNDETKKLFDKKIGSSITNTDFSLSWTNLYDYNKISYSLPAEIFPYAKDKSNKQTNNFGAYFFHNGKRSFDTTAALRMRGVKISDDTTFQQSNDTYYYAQLQDGTSVTSYPALDIIYSDNEKLCLFNKPMENYTYAKNLSNCIGIYDMFWKTYIDERYNVQNKKVTCYLRLKPTDFTNFEYNNFIKINNVLYFVNKIYNYNIASNESTKVDLITIQDIASYYVDYFSDYIEVSADSITLDGTSGSQDITINAYQNGWKYQLLDENGNVITSSSEITVTKINNTTLRVTKNGDYNIKYSIRIYTVTHSKDIAITGARSPYFEMTPTSVIVKKNDTTEFEVRIQTNFRNVIMIANNTVQWYKTSTSQWKTTAYYATDNVEGWGSGTGTYNEEHEDRDFTIRIKIVNPSASGNIRFIQSTPATQYYYLPYIAVTDTSLVILNSDGTSQQTTDSVDYRGTSSTRGYKVYSTVPWTASIPQGVRSYGPTSGGAGITDVTFDWGGNSPGSSRTITFNNSSTSATLSCSYVSQ